MMKKLIFSIITVGFIGLNLISCSSDDDSTPVGGENADINAFVWSGLNTWYYWQNDVPNLSNDISTDTYQSLIMNNTPETLFDQLLYQKGMVDRNSIIMSDYTELENLFSGVSISAGFQYVVGEFSDTGNLFLLIIYVQEGTSADTSGLKRGDIIVKVNNSNITVENIRTVLSRSIIDLELGDLDETEKIITPSGQILTVQTSQAQENPILLSKIFETGGKKVGYLVYNGFIREFNDELNAVFGDFKTQGINELILDLRYNGGGSVETSTYLASMITNQYNNNLYSVLKTNEKIGLIDEYAFTDQLNTYDLGSDTPSGQQAINQLNLNRLIVIGTGYTASASELIINGLRGQEMEVVLIGSRTYGKDVASITLYDSSDFSKENVNQDHKYAMQPIVAKNYNAKGESNYSNGFEPQVEAEDFPEGLVNIKQLGDLEEPMLNTALKYIDPAFVASVQSRKVFRKIPFKTIFFSKDQNPFNKDMIMHNFMKK